MRKLRTNKLAHFIFLSLIVVSIACLGIYSLLSSHAATPYSSSEAESGQLVANVLTHTDSTASGGSYVQFGTITNTKTPADLFDLSEWNLTLPIDSTGGMGGVCPSTTNPAEIISTQQLLTGFSDQYFQLNSSNQLVFTTPSNGATTTPCEGSNHTRAELHEYYTGTNATTNGTWLSSLGGTLQASAVVNATSVNSDEATIGQIHGNGGAAFVLLIYRPALQEVLLNVYDSPTASTQAETVILKNVTLGQTINYGLSFKDGVITAIANGTTITLTAGSDWDSFPVRFAIGAYSAAPNTGNPAGDETQVTFSSFKISH
jgi:hypothetical protein